MNRQTRIACLLLIAAAVAPPQSIGQALSGNGLTPLQYNGLQERVTEFCKYLAATMREGKQLPMGDLRLPGAGNGYVYSGGEVIALIPKCESLMPLMQRLIAPIK